MCSRFHTGYTKSLFGYVLIKPSLLFVRLIFEPGVGFVSAKHNEPVLGTSSAPSYYISIQQVAARNVSDSHLLHIKSNRIGAIIL